MAYIYSILCILLIIREKRICKSLKIVNILCWTLLNSHLNTVDVHEKKKKLTQLSLMPSVFCF